MRRLPAESKQFQSTLPLRGATILPHRLATEEAISIHTPLAGSDVSPILDRIPLIFQSTLPLRGATHPSLPVFALPWRFQSTLPLRGATSDPCRRSSRRKISIHTPLAGSDMGARTIQQSVRISIHTPLAGSDPLHALRRRTRGISIHTPLAGSDHHFHAGIYFARYISIHTPLAGSDTAARRTHREIRHFNPHSPCGERQPERANGHRSDLISIHTPLAGSDVLIACGKLECVTFQSTLPLRGATYL